MFGAVSDRFEITYGVIAALDLALRPGWTRGSRPRVTANGVRGRNADGHDDL
jgi:hypothetical protein